MARVLSSTGGEQVGTGPHILTAAPLRWPLGMPWNDRRRRGRATRYGARARPAADLVRTAAVVLALVVLPASLARAADVTVFAAASLTDAFETIGKAWTAKTGNRSRFSFAASSTLAKQIENGANADIFASADEQWMDYLAQRGLVESASRTTRLGNALVLVAPADRALKVELKPGFDLATLLGDGRLATGDPAHVPVGRYAEQALRKLGVWQIAEPRLARTDNVRAALLLVERGEVPLGIVYATDAAVTPKVIIAGIFPADAHAPIRYPFAIVAGRDRPEVRDFLAFLVGPEARAVYSQKGFRFE